MPVELPRKEPLQNLPAEPLPQLVLVLLKALPQPKALLTLLLTLLKALVLVLYRLLPLMERQM